MRKKTTLNQGFWIDEEKEANQQLMKRWLNYLFFSQSSSLETNLNRYYQWCSQQGFEKTLKKRKYLLEEERLIRIAEIQKEELEKDQRSKFLISKDQRITGLYNQIETQVKTNPHLQKSWEDVKQLRKSCVFSTQPFFPGSTADSSFILTAFFRLIHYQDIFKNELGKVKVKKSNPFSYFQKIVSETIELYPQPKALLSWWFKPQIKWSQAFVDLAQGKKVYEVFKSVEAIPLTQRQVYLLMNKFAKQTISYEKARLQSILASLNAPPKLENSLMRSPIFLEDLSLQYQLKVAYISFLTNNATFFDWNRTLDLWDYVLHLKDQTPAGEFSFKKRNLVNLIEGMNAWHAALGRGKIVIDDKRNWDKSGIGNYYFINEKTTEELKITELTSGREIHAEGKLMRHCVYSYVARCQGQQTAIFSLQYKQNHKVDWKSGGTIEVNLKMGQIVQFKAKYNAKPEPLAEFHLRKWADKENLRVRE